MESIGPYRLAVDRGFRVLAEALGGFIKSSPQKPIYERAGRVNWDDPQFLLNVLLENWADFWEGKIRREKVLELKRLRNDYSHYALNHEDVRPILDKIREFLVDLPAPFNEFATGIDKTARRFEEDVVDVQKPRPPLVDASPVAGAFSSDQTTTPIEEPDSWVDKYPAEDWASVPDFYLERLREGRAPFTDLKSVLSLGEGKYGRVYEVTSIQGFQLAIKLPKPGPDGKPPDKGIWRTEENAARRLKASGMRHDGIAKVMRLPPRECPGFISYEFVNGCPLARTLGAGEVMSPRKAVRIAYRVADTLSWLMDERVPFSDLHAGNVILRENKYPVLVDPAACWPKIEVPEWARVEPYDPDHQPRWSILQRGLVFLNARLLMEMWCGSRATNMIGSDDSSASFPQLEGKPLPGASHTRQEELAKFLHRHPNAPSEATVERIAELIAWSFTDLGENARNKTPGVFRERLKSSAAEFF